MATPKMALVCQPASCEQSQVENKHLRRRGKKPDCKRKKNTNIGKPQIFKMRTVTHSNTHTHTLLNIKTHTHTYQALVVNDHIRLNGNGRKIKCKLWFFAQISEKRVYRNSLLPKSQNAKHSEKKNTSIKKTQFTKCIN